MAFVQAESWVEEKASVIPDGLLDIIAHRGFRNVLGLAISLAIDLALILAVINLSRVETPVVHEVRNDIATFSLEPVSAAADGASATASAASASAPPSHVDAAAAPVHAQEWSVATLPATPALTPMPAQSQVEVPSPARGKGVGSSGSGGGSGYDPYAFASYQKPDPARMGGPALQPLPDALAKLETALVARIGRGERSIGIRAYVDPFGRIIRTELLSSSPPDLARQLASIAPGFALCAPDPNRSPSASVVVTLTV